MSMHMINGVAVHHKSKPKKITRKKRQQLEKEWREFNQMKKQQHLHGERMSFDEFVEYKHGRGTIKSKKQEFKELDMKRPDFRRTEVRHLEHRSTSVPARREPQAYTGTLVKGISQTHKSNLVPVINEQEIIDIARMRR